jgi:rhamnosyltransferase
MNRIRFGVVVPTYNAGPAFSDWIRALQQQTAVPESVLVIDSSSTDRTVELARRAGFRVEVIPQKDFDHGRTRQQALELLADIEIVVYLTQDAVLADPRALETLVACFDDEKVGTAYGRQLPRKQATPIEAHARLFNYPAESRLKSWADRFTLGFKAAFISNSFAAYRCEALNAVGGFPARNIVSEDTLVSARMLKAGWLNAYCAEACVYHSHHYSYVDEFRRYFDIGAFHASQPWILDEFGTVEGEGLRFVRSETEFLCPKHLYLLPSAMLRTVIKYAGFRFGKHALRLPVFLKRKLSMYPGYWD